MKHSALQIFQCFFSYFILSYNGHYQHVQQDVLMSICKLILTNCQKKNIGTTLFEARKTNFLRTNSIQLHPTPCFLSNQTWHDPRRSSRKPYRDLSGWPVVHGPSAKASLGGGPGRTSPVTKRKRRHFRAVWGLVGRDHFLWLPKKKGIDTKKQTWKKQDGYIEKGMCSYFFVVRKMRTAGFCWGLFKLIRTSGVSLVFWTMCLCSHWSNAQVVQV